ncbi:MAG: DUF2252 family protein, partial [Acidobacteriota bacterium]
TPVDGDARRTIVEAELDAAVAGLDAELRRERLDAMAPDVFTFVRATAGLYHRDLLDSGAVAASPFHIGAVTWLQGDAHVRNVGVFADDGGEVVFGLDDFDQAWPGSYLVDVWRMASTLVLFADRADVPGDAERAARAFAESYVDAVIEFAADQGEIDFQLTRDRARAPARRLILETLDEEGPKEMLGEWTRGKKDRRRFRSHEDLADLDDEAARRLVEAVGSYAERLDGFEDGYFRVKDVARRLKAGIGSRGVDRFYVLVEGPPGKADVILDVKAQVPRPSLARLFPRPPGLPEAGCRVARAEGVMLARADRHLGCLEMAGQSYSVRPRNPFKKSMKAKKIDGGDDLEELARDLGRVLAAAHSRADDDVEGSGVGASFDGAFAA